MRCDTTDSVANRVIVCIRTADTVTRTYPLQPTAQTTYDYVKLEIAANAPTHRVNVNECRILITGVCVCVSGRLCVCLGECVCVCVCVKGVCVCV